MRFVGRPDFDQPCSPLCTDVRDAEFASDFHQFSTGSDDLAPGSDGAECQEDGSRIVIDHHAGFGSGQPAEEF